MTAYLEQIFAFVLSKWYYSSAFFFVFFSILYLLGTYTSEWIIRHYKRKWNLHQIVHAHKPGQTRKEIQNSFVSVFVFSLQAIPFQLLYAHGFFKVGFDNPWACLWEIPILFLWNELHFYTMHWILHRRWFFKNVHKTHHWSKEPSSYSIYSFHWIEAFMLGTVIFFPVLFHEFQLISLLSLPVMSIIINLLGHCNHEFPSDKPSTSFSKFTFRHSMHHQASRGNFGFMLPIFDKIFQTQVNTNQKK